ncbi:MAG: hypothetical protein Ct9H300mP22_7150 [Gammaproteobacteria bacterium]|nr:MAG: hypothetical protein Ct9H300mP22_7150 [Gammaproteobacteria bacterium]
MFGISRYKIDDNPQILSASFAESASYIDQESDSYWQLNNVEESLFSTGAVITRNFLQEGWRVELSPELLSVLLVEPMNNQYLAFISLPNILKRKDWIVIPISWGFGRNSCNQFQH